MSGYEYEASGNFRTTDLDKSVVRVGKELKEYLTKKEFNITHNTTYHDYPAYSGSYARSLETVQNLLVCKDTQIVIDLHRDAVNEDTKLVTTLQENQTAKVMFFNGLSYSKEQGPISYLENPYLKENMAFSFQMKAACDAYYPGFARNIYLRAYRYNMHFTGHCMLVELGTQNNTVEEAQNGVRLLASLLYELLTDTK